MHVLAAIEAMTRYKTTLNTHWATIYGMECRKGQACGFVDAKLQDKCCMKVDTETFSHAMQL